MLVATALIEGNLREQITQRIPSDAPAFFFVDIQSTQIAGLREGHRRRSRARARSTRCRRCAGRIIKIGGKPVNEIAVPSDARWAVDGDRGVTYSATPPEGSRIVAGEWWAPDYRGPQLISFDESLAAAFGLGAGRHHHGERAGPRHRGQDRLAAAHRMDDARPSTSCSSIRPALLDKAPHTFLATVKATPEAEDAIFKTVTDQFPNVTVVRIRDAIETAASVLGNIGLASRVIGLLSILAGVLVLAGAMLATQRRRVHEAVVMKVLGATRARIAGTFAWEFAALGLATALAALGGGHAGGLSGGPPADEPRTGPSCPPSPWRSRVGAMALTLAFGLAGTLAALRQRPLGLVAQRMRHNSLSEGSTRNHHDATWRH